MWKLVWNMYPNTPHSETLRYELSCSIIQNVPQTDPWAHSGKWRKVPGSYISRSTLCALFSHNLFLFWNKTRWPFYQPQCLLSIMWFCSKLKGNIHTFYGFHGNYQCREGETLGFPVVVFLHMLHIYLSCTKHIQGVWILTVCALYEFDNIAAIWTGAALWLDCMKLPFYPPAMKEKTIWAWFIISMTVIFFARTSHCSFECNEKENHDIEITVCTECSTT